MKGMRSRALVTFALFATLLLGACGGLEDQRGAGAAPASSEATIGPTSEASASDAPTRDAPTSGGGGKEHVSAKVIDTDFRPLTLTIKAGSTVDWKQIGDQPHSVTAVDGSFDSSPDCGPIDPDKCLGEGDAFSFAFEKPGEFDYYCRVHGLPDGTGMFATIVIE